MAMKIVKEEKLHTICDNCQKDFAIKPNSFYNAKRHFCCRQCKMDYQQKHTMKYFGVKKRNRNFRIRVDGRLLTYTEYVKTLQTKGKKTS
jgi:predicted sulfurtransferase